MEVNEPSARCLAPTFKTTEFGVVPVDWEVRQLGELCSIRAGGDVDRGLLSSHEGPSHPYPIWANARSPLPYGYSSMYQCPAESLTVTARGDIGHAVYRDRPYCAIGRLLSLVPTSQVSARFIAEFINGRVAFASESTGVPQLTGPQIASHSIAIPSSAPETHQIAEALCVADALIDSLEQLLTKKRQIKQGAMQELLTGKRRLPGFSASRFDKTTLPPNDWTTVAIGQFAEVKTGPFGSALHERDYVQSGTPIVTVEHLAERGIQGDRAPRVSAADVLRLQAYKLAEGDIVFSRVGSIDRNARISAAEAGWLFSGRLLRLRIKSDEFDSQFLSYLFHGEPFRNQVERVAVGQTMASLNTKLLSGLEVALPSVAEQTAIAEALTAMDNDIAALESRLTKARALKQAMAQALLTGRIRLVEPNT